MFARAAIVGRVARERSEARRHFQQQKQELKKKTPQAPWRQRCFIPVIRGPCITVAFGFFLILIGAIMCNFAFHAEELSIVKINTYGVNTTATEVVINDSRKKALKSLTFVGPGLMGMGIFIIIIACVLLLDERDKILKEYIDSIIRNQQELSMELSLHAASSEMSTSVKRLKKTSSAYLQLLDERRLSDTTVACAVSISSAPCMQTFRAEMEDIEEMPNGQNIELAILNEHKSDESEAESETKIAIEEDDELEPERCSLLANESKERCSMLANESKERCSLLANESKDTME